MSPETMQKIVHELHVHQIELEMQNEELRLAQGELSAARERYFELYELAPVGYCTVDEAGLILEANLTFATLLGVPQQILVKQPMFRFIDKADRDIYYLLGKKIAQTGTAQSVELHLVRKDGSIFWVSVIASVVPGVEGASVSKIIFTDISVRKNMEMQLLESQQRLQGMVDTAMDAIVTIDDAHHIVLYNPAAEKMFGVSAAEAIGGSLERFMQPHLRQRYHNNLVVNPSRSIGEAGPVIALRANGEEFPIETAISQVEIQGKKLYTAIIRDCTLRNRAEAALQSSQERLHELVAHQLHIREDERIRIAREIHDELGSVLTGIKANLSVAMYVDQEAGAAPNQRLIDASLLLDTAVDTMRKVIADLRPSVLDQLGVWTALEWYAEQTETRTGLCCRVEIDEAAETTDVDADRSTALFRILQESLTNVVRHAAATQVDIRVICIDGSINMEIQDNGKGIEMARQPGHNSWGIAGMSERARHFGGRVDVTSLAPGTLVSVHLPLERRHV